jgi:hypothetical protein
VRATIRWSGCKASAFALIFLAAFCPAADDEAQPPVKGRPVLFSGIVGAVEIQASAAPTELQAESPLVFKLRLKGPSTLATLAVPDLHKVKGFDTAFAIRLLAQRWLPQEKTREFEFELRPRNSSIAAIPPFPFVIYVPAEKGYQTRYTQSIPLHVTPPPATSVQELKIENIPESPAEQKLSFDFSPAVLAEPTQPWAPTWGLLVLIGVLPAVLVWWRVRKAWSIRRPPAPECSQTLELARLLLGINLAEQDADNKVRVVLDSSRDLITSDSRLSHGPRCRCARLLEACQAYLYGGNRRDALDQLLQEARTVSALEQRGGR